MRLRPENINAKTATPNNDNRMIRRGVPSVVDDGGNGPRPPPPVVVKISGEEKLD